MRHSDGLSGGAAGHPSGLAPWGPNEVEGAALSIPFIHSFHPCGDSIAIMGCSSSILSGLTGFLGVGEPICGDGGRVGRDPLTEDTRSRSRLL